MKPTTLRIARLESRLAPAVATWDGGGANANWTTAANWVGDVVPQPGDDLVFPTVGQGVPPQAANVNDYSAGTAFHSIKIADRNYRLTGNGIALAAGVIVDGAGDYLGRVRPEIGLPLTLTADQTFTNNDNTMSYLLSGPVNLNGHALTIVASVRFGIFPPNVISGPFTGTGSLTFSGGSSSTLLTGDSTFTGPTTVSDAGLAVNGTLPGPVTVGSSGVNSGLLSGHGTVGDLTVTGLLLYATSGLKTGNLSLGPANGLDYQFSDTAKGLFVTGAGHVGGTLITQLSYPPGVPGTRYSIINNDGTDPIVGTFSNVAEGAVMPVFSNTEHGVLGTVYRFTYHGGDGNDFVATVVGGPAFAVGSGPGSQPRVNVYAPDGSLITTFLAYAAGFRGGVRVATADVTGDGIQDIITAPGPGGGPHVKVFDGSSFAVVREFIAYDPAFTGGVFVAAAKINFDAQAEIITGAGAGGGPHVKVFDGATGAVLQSFFAYDAAFRGGVSVAGTDSYSIASLGTQTAGSIITGAGPGGGPHVKVMDGLTGALRLQFFAYEAGFRGGVHVASRGPLYDLAALGILNSPYSPAGAIVTARASNGAPEVHVYGPTGQLRQFQSSTGPVGYFLAYDSAFQGGVTVAVEAIDAGGNFILEAGAGTGGGPHVKVWYVTINGASVLQTQFSGSAQTQSFFAFDPAFRGGVFVG